MNNHSQRAEQRYAGHPPSSSLISPARGPAAGDAPFSPDAHARYGHRLAQFSPAPPVLQRQAEDDGHQMTEAEDDGGDMLQMKAEGRAAARPDVPVAAGGGGPMPDPVRGKMERSFGHSFADVRIHSGGEAKQVGALAYTRGTDIHFQPGLYDPLSLGGHELLGHELTHVVQQKAGRVSAPQSRAAGGAPINADASLEGEADAMGARAARGQTAHVSGTSGGGLQRRADVVQCFRLPWQKLQSGAETVMDKADTLGGPTNDVGGWAGGIGTTAQHFNDAPSPYGSPMDIGISDKIAGGLGFAGLLSAPSQLVGVGQGVREMWKGAVGQKVLAPTAVPASATTTGTAPAAGTPTVTTGTAPAAVAAATPQTFTPTPADNVQTRVRDGRRVLEGAGTVGQNLVGLASTGANVVSGASTLAGAAGVAGVASGVAAPIAVVAGGAAAARNGYQFGMAEYKRRQLGNLAKKQAGYVAPAQPQGVGGHLKSALTPHGWGESAIDSSTTKTPTQKAIEYAQSTQHKRRNRAGLNFASNSLMVAGGVASTVGAATAIGAPVGAAVGAGLAGAGLGLKGGAFAARKLKQGGRNLAAWADKKSPLPAAGSATPARLALSGSHTNRFARVVNTVNDNMGPLSFNTGKSSEKKKQALDTHTQTILNDTSAGKDIFKGLGASKADQAKHARYLSLAELGKANDAEALRVAQANAASTGGPVPTSAPTPTGPAAATVQAIEDEKRKLQAHLERRIGQQLKKRG